jgi:hypothetical protein
MRMKISSISVMNFFFMLGIAVIFAVDENLLKTGPSHFYDFYLKIAPQVGYAVATFVISILLFTAYVLRNRYFEILGLFGSGLFTMVILSGYLLEFPNIGSVMLGVWTLATFMTIADKLNYVQDEKERS